MNDLTVEKLEELINISLDKGEEKKLKEDFKKILNFVDKINEIGDEDIDYLNNTKPGSDIVHEEKVFKFENIEDIHNNFPNKEDSFVSVPKYIKE